MIFDFKKGRFRRTTSWARTFLIIDYYHQCKRIKIQNLVHSSQDGHVSLQGHIVHLFITRVSSILVFHVRAISSKENLEYQEQDESWSNYWGRNRMLIFPASRGLPRRERPLLAGKCSLCLLNQSSPLTNVLTHFRVAEGTWWLEQISRWRQCGSRRTLQSLLLISRNSFQNIRKDSKMYHPSRGGVRGGQDQFDWEDVKADKYRENYLGESRSSVF